MTHSFVSPDEGCAKGKTIALQALAIDPNAPEAHTSLAWALQYYDFDFVSAEREYRRSIELDPHYIVAHYWLSMSLAWQGRYDEAITEVRRALTLDPLSIAGNPFLCMAYFCARRFEEMAAHAHRTIELYPTLPQVHWALGLASLQMSNHELAIAEFETAIETSGGATLYRAMLAEAQAAAGNRDVALRMMRELLQNAAREYVTPYMIARIHAALNQKEDAFQWLETGWRERAAWMPFLKVDSRMDVLRTDQRFSELMGRINYPPIPAH